MEIWNRVDEHGNFIETMSSDDPRVWQKGIYHQAADVWVVNSKGEILIQKRAACKRFAPNKWAMTGGSVIHGETSLDTIKRENREELGFELNTEDAVKIASFQTGSVYVDEFVVLQDVDPAKCILQESEVAEVKFATLDEVKALHAAGNFIANRWDFVQDGLENYIKTSVSNKSG